MEAARQSEHRGHRPVGTSGSWTTLGHVEGGSDETADKGSGSRSTPPRDSTCPEQGGRGAAL